MTVETLPGPVAAYFAATNAFDIDALMATFAPDALVNDHRDEFVGSGAIRAWALREIIGDGVTMEVTEATQRGNSVAVNAVVRGNFDKTGLPDRLVLTSYFSVSGDRIVQLIIVFNNSARRASG